ncbi:Abi family protein [Rhodopseudomonas sp. HC1]|uniref:Abi family protein n=1 Tax=Rhodopseudomonas infernalis TaxID=2897386 RepID=UPI001EE80A2A|nr:Abi family protein [Rhodopseudomonas infernalis]MCG6204718.1 Abi family protein [Rhodopseudomonas infernalis]
MRTQELNEHLKKSISIKRLEKYLAAVGGDLDKALKLYEENMRLAEAFYSPLQCLEVCLRNALNSQMCTVFGDDWLTTNKAPLGDGARVNIQKAIIELQRHGHSATQDDIVAELNLGFWVGLLGPAYDATLWRMTLYKAFNASGGQKRSVVHGRFNALRRFRNRVAHHEPIFQKPLEQLHTEIIGAIGWMCRHTSSWALYHSRFEIVSTTATD